MPFTQELAFGPYASGIWTESPQIEYRTLLLYGDPIMSLFAAGEQGFWYDPSDFSTLFQGTAGTVPVTAVGQSVGLVLDKSKGLVLGPELRTATAVVLGSWTQSGGVVTAPGSAGVDSASFTLSSPTVVGRFYEVLIPNNMPSDAFFVDFGSGTGSRVNSLSASTQRIILTCTAPGTVIRVGRWSGSPTGTIGPISVRELPGNHATQNNASQRPILRQNGSLYYLEFDGTDDFLVTGTITPGTDKAQVFAGVRKVSDAAAAMPVDFGSLAAGSLAIQAPASAADNCQFTTGGSLAVNATAAGYAAPITNVLTGLGDIAGDSATLRVNGAVAATSSGDQGTGNYLAYPLYIGGRGGSSLPFNGHIYSLIGRFGANLTTAQIEAAERWVASKTGVTL